MPLNALVGYAELLVDGIYSEKPERPKSVLERIHDNGKHLLALINDVLGLAKIEADQVTLRLGDYNMPDLVRSVVRNRTTRRRQEIEMRRSDRRRPADSAW